MTIASVQDLTVSEGDGFADVVIRLDAPSGSPVTLAWRTADGTAFDQAGFDFDYQAASGTLSFAPGETEKTVRVSLRQAATVTPTDIEGNEWFNVVLSNPVGTRLDRDGLGWITVVDNDTVVAAPELHVSDAIVDETSGQVHFVVTLGRVAGTSSLAPVSVDVATRDGSAAAGSDYTALQTTLRFAPGETAKTVTVPLLNDADTETVETFSLQLSNAQGGVIARSAAQASIAANDAAPAVRPQLSVQPATWSEGTPWLDIPVTLSAPSAQRVTVRWQTADDSAGVAVTGRPGDFTAQPGLLSFEPGQTVQVVRLRMSPSDLRVDGAPDEVAERFAVLLSEPTNASLAHEGLAWITMIDNDEASPMPLVHVRDLVVDEGAGQAVFSVTLGRLHGQASAQPVTVQVATADGSASAGSDYIAVRTSLTFQPGESVQTVAVPLLNDAGAERDETFSLQITGATGATIGTAAARATIGANDAAPAGLPLLTVQSMTVSEADRWADVVVSLSAPSATRVTVAYSTGHVGTIADDFGFQSGSLVFEPGETTRVVTLSIGGTVADTSGQEPGERLRLSLSSPVGATLAAGGVGWIDIVDNDTLVDSPAVTVRDVLVDERAETAQFVVMLGRDQGSSTHAPLTLNYSTRDGSGRAGEDYVATRGSLTFLPGESAKTVSVPLLDDRAPEGLESFDLVVTGTALDGSPVAQRAGATIAPNDGPAQATPGVSALPTVVVEDEGWTELWVVLSAASAQRVSVPWSLQAGTADVRDYGRGSGTLVFEPGVTALPVRVTIHNDTSVEPVETSSLVLGTPQGARLDSGRATIAIVDAVVGGVPVQAGNGGNDRYEVQAATDLVIELPFGGFDTLVSAVDITLPAQVEALLLQPGAVNGTGNDESNTFTGHAGDNRFDGRGGIDTVVYAGTASQYAVNGGAGNFNVSGAGSGRDTLVSIERLQFSDQVQAWDTSAGGRAYTVAALLNAGFARVPDMADVARWTATYDTLARDLGDSAALAQLMLNTYVPDGIPDDALVAHLWQSVVGSPIGAAELAQFTGLLHNGTYTQASLLAMAAEQPLNTADLAALTGLPWVLDAAWFVTEGV